MELKYPVSKPVIEKEELDNVVDAVKSTWISSSGKYITEFEKEFAKFCGRKYAVAVFNGTVAIHLTLEALGIKEGDEVIVPSFTFIASVNPIVYQKAKPVFVDIDKDTLCMSADDVEKKITKKTKAIMVVDLYSHTPDMDKITAIAKKHGLKIIEDAAEAHGTEYKGKKAGSFGDISCFSFYGNKIITTGEGGMCLTDNEELYKKMMQLKNHGMSETRKYFHPVIGYNYRMTNLQAAIGLAQMKKIGKIIRKRQETSEQYKKELEDTVEMQNIAPWCMSSHWFVNIFAKDEKQRDYLIEELKKQGIDSRPFFYPVHKMPPYQEYNNLSFPNTEIVSRTGINLPTYYELTKKDVIEICNVIKSILKQKK